MHNKANDTYSLAHTSWKCQYHIVFAPKYRRKAKYGKLKAERGAILRELCERKHVNIIEAHTMPDPYSYAGGDTAKPKSKQFYGVFEMEKHDDNI